MKKAGLKRINYGIEAATDNTLKAIKKGIRIADVREAVKNAKEVGLTIVGYFMVGLPTDTMTEFKQILDLSLELDLDYANYSSVIAYPGTELYTHALSQNIIKEDVWLKYIKDPSVPMDMPIYTERYGREVLIDYVNKCYKRFYFRPKRIMKELKSIASLKQFGRKFKTAMALFHQ